MSKPGEVSFLHSIRQIHGIYVSQRGIEVNFEKLEAIEGMESYTCHREVQSLNEILTALNHFLSKSGDISLLFFQVLKANRKFAWTPECDKAFQD